LEILLEDIRSKFDLVLEGHSSLHAEMQGMRRDLTERIDHVDFKVDTLSSRIDAVDQKVDALDKKVDAVEANLDAHRVDTEAHHGVYRVKESGE